MLSILLFSFSFVLSSDVVNKYGLMTKLKHQLLSFDFENDDMFGLTLLCQSYFCTIGSNSMFYDRLIASECFVLLSLNTISQIKYTCDENSLYKSYNTFKDSVTEVLSTLNSDSSTTLTIQEVFISSDFSPIDGLSERVSSDLLLYQTVLLIAYFKKTGINHENLIMEATRELIKYTIYSDQFGIPKNYSLFTVIGKFSSIGSISKIFTFLSELSDVRDGMITDLLSVDQMRLLQLIFPSKQATSSTNKTHNNFVRSGSNVGICGKSRRFLEYKTYEEPLEDDFVNDWFHYISENYIPELVIFEQWYGKQLDVYDCYYTLSYLMTIWGASGQKTTPGDSNTLAIKHEAAPKDIRINRPVGKN